MKEAERCEFCMKPPAKERLVQTEAPRSYVRVCGKCLKKMRSGKPLVDVYDFAWWIDKKGIHAAHVDDERAPKGLKARKDVLWVKVDPKQ